MVVMIFALVTYDSMTYMQELTWYDEVLSAELRTGDATSFADR